MYLIDYKVRVLSPTRTNIPDAAEENGTGSNVRVLIESSDGVASWDTVGVSYSIIEASLEVWRTPSRASSTRRSRPDGARNADKRRP